MRDFLLALQNEYDQIAKTETNRMAPGLSVGGVISACKKTTGLLSEFRRTTEKIIQERLFPMLEEPGSITDEDEEEIFATTQKISAYESRSDPGLALKIYQGLLTWARGRGDEAKILKYLYWCGITLHFFAPDEFESILNYFCEGASYRDKYDTFDDPETRKYIHRCLGNTSMMYYIMGERDKAREMDDIAYSFWNWLIFTGKDQDFPWLNYFLTCLSHKHAQLTRTVHSTPDEETKEGLSKILESAITINKLYHKNKESFSVFGGSRYDFDLWEAQFLNGLISFEMLYDNIEKKKAEFAPDDYSPDAMYVKHDLNIYLVHYATSMRRLKYKSDEVATMLSKETIDYFSNTPKTMNTRDIASQLVYSAKYLSKVLDPSEQLDFVMKLTTYRHVPTYAHSIVVGKIASCLTRYLAKEHPGSFIGFIGITRAEEAFTQVEKLCDFAETSGLCHDIGKIAYVMNPYMHARILTDEELEIIKRHPEDGKTMLAREDESLYYEGFTDVIMGHHKYYDNSGGYPASFDLENSKYSIMINIISVADSIDAATDSISKTYANAKSLETVCAEIKAESGSRYSPVVANALDDEEVFMRLRVILGQEREAAYYTAYLHAWS